MLMIQQVSLITTVFNVLLEPGEHSSVPTKCSSMLIPVLLLVGHGSRFQDHLRPDGIMFLEPMTALIFAFMLMAAKWILNTRLRTLINPSGFLFFLVRTVLAFPLRAASTKL